DRRELVQHAVDLHRRDRGALDRGEQHPPQRVTDRRAEAALERLRVKAPEPVGEGLALEFEPLGPLKTFPQHVSDYLSFGRPVVNVRRTCDCAPCLPPQVLERLRAESVGGVNRRYFEYNSTMSCSCTGRLICS